MSEDALSPAVEAFIADYVSSVVELEILLLLAAGATQDWTAATVSLALRIDRAWAADHLRNLCAQGLASGTDAPDPVYRYAPRTAEMGAAVAELSRAYADRRVSVISLIFSKPVDKIRTFADAFRFRKD